jgi:hypothetical protein
VKERGGDRGKEEGKGRRGESRWESRVVVRGVRVDVTPPLSVWMGPAVGTVWAYMGLCL